MSRLPRPHSSPDAKGFAPSLKRKVIPEEDDIEEQPNKKGSGFRPKPLQASRNATNANVAASASSVPTSSKVPPKSAAMPRPLTRPRPPAAARPTARGASAPPVSTARKPSSGSGAGLASRFPSSTALGKRTASGSHAEPTVAAPDVITNLHKRLTTLESARTHDTERLTTLFETKSSATASAEFQSELITKELQLASTTAQLNTASAQLVAAQAQVASLQTELGAARGSLRARDDSEAELRKEVLALKAEVLAGKAALATAQDEAAEVRRALVREREEGEIRVRRGERLLREAKDDLEEKEARFAKLRAELAGAVDAEVGLQERYRAMTGRVEALQEDIASLLREKEAWALERQAWEEERQQLREESVRGEEERRKLHGMVMELKGNIRVFCRVRPLLTSEEESGGEDVGAQIAYPDASLPYPSGQKEIVLSSTGAEREWDAGMGNKQRKEVWNFNFDRVCLSWSSLPWR